MKKVKKEQDTKPVTLNRGRSLVARDQQYDNSGILFKNRDKEEDGANDKWPDYKGSATIDGVEYWMNAWIKEGNKGKFMSFSFKPKQQRYEPKPKVVGGRDYDDEIPF